MKCQILFSGRTDKYMTNLLKSQRVVKVKKSPISKKLILDLSQNIVI